MTNVTKMQVLSPEATKEFNDFMNPVIKTDMFTSVSLHVTPEGVLQTPLRVFDNGFITDQSGNKKLQQTVARGYKQVSLTYTGRVYKNTGVHRLVLFSFKQEWSTRGDKTVVHHLDGNKGNNNINNLQLDDNRNNVLRFWDGRENAGFIASKQYQSDRIAKGRVPMMHKCKLVPGYEIDTKGYVYHVNKVTGAVNVVTPSIANKKYPTNKNIKFNGTSASIHGLVAENFTIVPDGPYKTLLIDKTLQEPYTPENIYTVPRKF